MSDFQAIVGRVEIEALRGEFTDAVMMRDRARLASLFMPDGGLRMPDIPAEMAGQQEILTGGERLQSQWDFFVQTMGSGGLAAVSYPDRCRLTLSVAKRASSPAAVVASRFGSITALASGPLRRLLAWPIGWRQPGAT
jgi:hypothetical protein